jgi:hypothetical protein
VGRNRPPDEPVVPKPSTTVIASEVETKSERKGIVVPRAKRASRSLINDVLLRTLETAAIRRRFT